MKPKTNSIPLPPPQEQDSDASRNDAGDHDESVGGKECGMCHDVPESIIYLSCEHIVCLVCAAKLILGGIGQNQAINLSEVVCGLCHETTILSVEVQETLIEFLNQQDFEDDEENPEEEHEDEAEAEGSKPYAGDDESEENSVQIKSSNSRHRVSDSNELGASVQKDSKGLKNDSVVPNTRPSVKPRDEKEDSQPKRNLGQANDKSDGQRNRNSPTGPPAQKSRAQEADSRPQQTQHSKIPQKQSDRAKVEKRKQIQMQTTENEELESEEAPESHRLGDADDKPDDEPSDFLSTFYCAKHADEEYTYYNPSKKTLLCAQCLITEVESKEELSLIRPLKKCLPEILQNFQDMLNEIEVAKSLLENKRKDFEIRKEGAKVHAVSMAKKLELAFDEILDFVQEVKVTTLKALEVKNKALLNELEGKEEAIEERAAFFCGVLEEVTNLRQNSQSPEEELFVFFFSNQERILKSLQNETAQNADNETIKINRIFDEFTSKVKLEQTRQCRVGQETIREKLLKNIASLGGASVPELPDAQKVEQKTATLTADFGRPTMNTTKNAFSKQQNSLLTLGDGENSNRFANQPPAPPADPSLSSKRLNTYANSQTYGQFVEKVKNLPSRNTNSLDVNKYMTQVRGVSRGAAGPLIPQMDAPLFAKDFTSSNYYKTISKNSYNLEKKMELEQKLKFFDLKGRKDDTNSSGYSSILNKTGTLGVPPFQPSTSVQKPRPDARPDARSFQMTSFNSSYKAGPWMMGK